MPELHQQVVQWLHAFNIVPKDSPALRPDASLSDVVALLRDGVILCQLVHSLDPACLDMTRVMYESGSAASDFLCRNNIFLFLHAIVSSFGLSMEKHFFEPEDLYLCRNVAKVFETLSSLSHSPKVSKSGVPGFPRKEKLLAKKLQKEMSYYQELNELYETSDNFVYDSIYSNSQDLSDQVYHNEDIYQTIFPPGKSRRRASLLTKMKSKRQAPIKELKDTEDKYLENLIMVRDKFRDRLSAMNAADKDVIFFCLDDFILLHSDLLFDLKPKKANIGAVLCRHMSRMENLYASYCVHLPRSMERLDMLCQQSPLLRKQLLECQSVASPPTFPLSSHLVLPFQRFLKYHLLLKEILKQTPEDHAERAALEEAVKKMLAACQQVNEKKREHEEEEKQLAQDDADLNLIQQVAQSIKLMRLEPGFKLQDYGRLRKAGDVMCFVPGDSSNKACGDYAFLFDVMILMCHRPKWMQHRYRFRRALKIKDHYLEQPATGELRLRLFSKIGTYRSAGPPTLTLVVKNQADRSAWFSALLTALDAVHPAENATAGHVLQMTSFLSPAECFHCLKRLTGKFYQGYRCLRCQANLHKACIAKCACLEVGCLSKADSMSLPRATLEEDEDDDEGRKRTGSTLSLASPSARPPANNEVALKVQALRNSMLDEQEQMPLEKQSWFAGDLPVKIATDRLESLPVGTFLIRQRANGGFALMLKSPEMTSPVKSMKIESEIHPETGEQMFYLSAARSFSSIAKLVTFYRSRDLTENFNYESLRGVPLRTPYKDI